MAPKVFITGITGYIGGDVFYALHQKHPDWTYTALVRSPDKGHAITAAYPDVLLVHGDLDNSDLLKAQAAAADIVIHTADAADHAPAAHALLAGLASSPHTTYYLHTSGTAILSLASTPVFGTGPPPTVYNDLADITTLTSLPSSAIHRPVDEIVLAASTAHAETLKTAIVCPPTIYGKGRGPGSTRGLQVYELARVTLQTGAVPIVGAGTATWDNIHIHDLSALYLALAERAAAGSLDASLWGAQGYYFAENGAPHVWGEVARGVAAAAAARGWVKEAGERVVEGVEEAAGLVKGGVGVSWGWNARGVAGRAREVLGWEAVGGTLEEELGEVVGGEWERLEGEKV